MAQLPRVPQNIFCETAQENQTAVFGTMKTGTGTFTSDIAQLMSNSAWQSGFSEAVIANYAPFMEEFNGILKVITQQLAYIFQNGVAAYDANTTYYKGSYVKNVKSDGSISFYYSLTDNNTGNDLTNTSYWQESISLPSQTGNAGKFLTTDGTNASWATVVSSTITYWDDAMPADLPTAPTIQGTTYEVLD